MSLSKIIRYLSETIILVYVWHNAHWSVALTLTLQTIALEWHSIKHNLNGQNKT